MYGQPPGRLERLMFYPLPLWVTLLLGLCGLIVLVVFGTLVRRGAGGDDRPLSRAAMFVVDVPGIVRSQLSPPNPAIVTPKGPSLPDGFAINRRQPLADAGYALFVRYSQPAGRFVALLTRLSDGAVLRRYAPDTAAINARSTLHSPIVDIRREFPPSRYRMEHAYLMEDGGLIFHADAAPLVRVDACGRIRWTIDGLFHHAIERDADGTFVTSGMPPRSKRPYVSPQYRDDQIVRFSADGRLLSATGIGDILAANGLAPLWQLRLYNDDPFHLNDIQPVVANGPFWRRGDLFVSLRSLSLLALYRPSTGRIVWAKSGPWNKQHDINILDDHRISVFDNRALPAPSDGGLHGDRVDGHSRLLVYDFASGRVTSPYDRAFAAHAIRAPTEGRGTPLPGGDLFVEETTGGRVMRMAIDGTLRWRYVAGDAIGRRYMLGWSRYLDPARYRSSIEAATKARCS